MAVRTKTRPSPTDEVPLYPAYGYLMRRQRHPIGVRGGPRRAPRGYQLSDNDQRQVGHCRSARTLIVCPGWTRYDERLTLPPAPVAVAVAEHAEGDAPPYLEVSSERFTATLTREPQRQEVPALRDIPLAVHSNEEVAR
ncbi:hypothetical protein GA0070607_1216 [Micromonospora coriariae]|uniref:Uncharacterized protein n=1 Tax=Micromonospora coriariae TaxID=285665 RepID=A0A1C4UW75_9ACTN|nr:hypothetical protein [Micromonospora coriariae]SCE75956.1 hypothetical protein GA0070607_1216 [Micromonospora coriariae]